MVMYIKYLKGVFLLVFFNYYYFLIILIVEANPLVLPGGKISKVSRTSVASLLVLFLSRPCKRSRKICHKSLLILSCAEYNPIHISIFLTINLHNKNLHVTNIT